jgi:hypothetical protein
VGVRTGVVSGGVREEGVSVGQREKGEVHWRRGETQMGGEASGGAAAGSGDERRGIA